MGVSTADRISQRAESIPELHERSTIMKYRLLGKSGLRVSEAALGTMTFGDEWGWGSPKAEAQKVYETYREAGGNFIDSANFYTMWKRSCDVWTTSFAKARFSTSGSRTLPLGGSPRQILWRSFEAGHSSRGCRSSTASWSGRSSANLFLWRKL